MLDSYYLVKLDQYILVKPKPPQKREKGGTAGAGAGAGDPRTGPKKGEGENKRVSGVCQSGGVCVVYLFDGVWGGVAEVQGE